MSRSFFLRQWINCQKMFCTFRTLHSTGTSLRSFSGMQGPPNTFLEAPDSCWHTMDTLQSFSRVGRLQRYPLMETLCFSPQNASPAP